MVRRTRPQMCNCTSGNLEIPGSLAPLAPRNDVLVLARAEPVIGRAFARPVGLAGTTENYFATPISRKYFNTPGWISSELGAAATVFAAVVSQACASFLQNVLSTPCSVRASR